MKLHSHTRRPLVSIVTPSYNQARYLADNLQSVSCQTWDQIEHLVYDGGSDDESVEILREYEGRYNLVWRSERDGGQSNAVNEGFARAKGEIVYWLNSDDALLTRTAIEEVVGLFELNPEADVIYGDRIVVDGNSNLQKLQYTNQLTHAAVLEGLIPIFQENVFFRRHVVERRRLNADLNVVMDTDYWIRLSREFRFFYVPRIFAFFRIHESNKTVSQRYVATWNSEKRFLLKEYGAKRFKVGVGPQPLRYLHRLRCLASGAYNNYRRIFRDLRRVRNAKDLATAVHVRSKYSVRYLYNSLLPYRR